jgi:hypothetical protein
MNLTGSLTTLHPAETRNKELVYQPRIAKGEGILPAVHQLASEEGLFNCRFGNGITGTLEQILSEYNKISPLSRGERT